MCVCVTWGGIEFFFLVSDKVGLRIFGVRWGRSKFCWCQMEWE